MEASRFGQERGRRAGTRSPEATSKCDCGLWASQNGQKGVSPAQKQRFNDAQQLLKLPAMELAGEEAERLENCKATDETGSQNFSHNSGCS